MNIQKNIKYVISFTVLVDVLGIGIIIPILPFYVKSFGMNAIAMTILFSVFSACSLFSTPILGALSDKYGRKIILAISLASTSVGWFIFGFAGSILFLFIGRIIDGLAAGNFGTAQSVLSDISRNEKERSQNFGLIGALFGIGLILGPALGGLLMHISNNAPFLFAGAMALINTILMLILLPETNLNQRENVKINFNPIKTIFHSFTKSHAKSLFTSWFVFHISMAIFQSIFSLYLLEVFGFNSSMVAVVLASQGIIMIINQGFLLKHFWLKKFSLKNLSYYMYVFIAVATLFFAVENIYFLFLGILVLSLSQPVLRVAVTSEVISNTHETKRGEVLGVMASIANLGMIIGPLFSGFLYSISFRLPFIVSFLILMAMFAILGASIRKYKKSEKIEDCISI